MFPGVLLLILVSNSAPPLSSHQSTDRILNFFLIRQDCRIAVRSHFEAYRHVWRIASICDPSRRLSYEFSEAFATPDFYAARAVLRVGDQVRCIQSPKDLARLVQVPHSNGAEEYLNAFANIYSIRLFPQYSYVAVKPDTDVDNRFAHADYVTLNKRTRFPCLPAPIEDDAAFIFTRYLLEYDVLSPKTMHATVERLWRDGAYEMTVLFSIPYNDIQDIVSLPRAPMPR